MGWSVMGFWCKVLGHRWEMPEGQCERQCIVCGNTEAVPCQWHYCACQRCGSLRDEQHDWLSISECEEVCRVCGQERKHHHWQPQSRGVDKCRHCGKVHKLTPAEIDQRDEKSEFE